MGTADSTITLVASISPTPALAFAAAPSVTERYIVDGFLSFLSDLILLTAGIAVLILWIVVFVAIAIEIYDGITGKGKETPEAEELIE